MKRVFLLVTLAVALCASALGQNDLDQVKIKCPKGHEGCTLTHENDGQGGIQDLGGAGTTGNDIDQLGGGGGTPPPTGGVHSDPPTSTGDGDPVLTPPAHSDGDQPTENEAEKAERLAREQRERVEAARKRTENAKTERERQRAAQEMMRAQNRMRTEMDRSLARVRQAATSSSTKFQSALKVLQAWQTAMVEAGLEKDLLQFYKTNKEEIEQLLIAYGTSDNPGALRKLAGNADTLGDIVSEYEQLQQMYPDAGGSVLVAMGKQAQSAESTANSANAKANTAFIAALIAIAIGVISIIVRFFGGGGAKTPKVDLTITYVSPNNGPVTGGTKVRVTGTGFTGKEKVLIDGQSVNYQYTATEIEFDTPKASKAGMVDIVIKRGWTKAELTDAFEYV